jgi:hypothetical protein
VRLERSHGALAGSTPTGTLHYYGWIDYVSPETFKAFTKATGITVKKSYYVSNEALLAKVMAGGREYDLAAPTGYMVAILAGEGLLERIDWKQLPTVKRNIDPKFLGLPHDPKNLWSVPKDWGTTGFVYRTDLIKERPTTWKQFFGLFKKYPRKLTLLDGSAEVIGSVAVMMGYSFNTESDAELRSVRRFLVGLKPYVHSFDSSGYARKIASGAAFGGLGWNGDGAYVVSRRHAAGTSAREVRSGRHVVLKARRTHRPPGSNILARINAIETLPRLQLAISIRSRGHPRSDGLRTLTSSRLSRHSRRSGCSLSREPSPGTPNMGGGHGPVTGSRRPADQPRRLTSHHAAIRRAPDITRRAPLPLLRRAIGRRPARTGSGWATGAPIALARRPPRPSAVDTTVTMECAGGGGLV